MPRNPFPGYWAEKLPSGNFSHRVRMEGNKRKVTTVPVGPEHPDFLNHYWAARGGEKYTGPSTVIPAAPAKSLRWLVDAYLEHLGKMVAGGNASPLTLKQRRSQLHRLCAFEDADGDPYGTLHLDMPTSAFVRARNAMAETPAEADNTMKAVRAMYRYASEIGEIAVNPAVGIGKIHKSKGGAKPWTAGDLRAYRDKHPPGTMAHLYLTLLMFTGCRIGDALFLGRKHEFTFQGQQWLGWQPGKKGSAPVELPMLPPLLRTVRGVTVEGPSYVLNEQGKPFRNVETLRTRVARWCEQAGLEDRSSHGVRKAMATLLSESGMSDKQIGAVLSHTKAETTGIYTASARRRVLSADAMEALRALEW